MREDYIDIFRVGASFRKLLIDFYYDSYKKELTYRQCRAFDYICNHENTTSNDLVKEFSLSKQHIGLITDKLQSEGYIRKEVNPKDRRYSFLTLTEKGREYYDEHIRLSYENYDSLMDKLLIDEQEEFRQSIKKLKELFLKMTK